MEAADRVVVVGAGICGLTIGHLLQEAGRRVVILERLPKVGGLARSFTYGDYTFDIGPHRFYTENQDVGTYIRRVMGDEGTTFPRKSSVHFQGRYYPWPVRPSSLVRFPPRLALRIGADLLVNPLRTYGKDSFEDYVLAQYGPSLYQHFFLDYSEKFLKIHPRATHADWAKAGINRAIIDNKAKMNNLLDLVRSSLKRRQEDELHFLYPRSGMQAWSDRAAQAFIGLGGALYTDVANLELEHDGHQIRAVRACGQRFPVSHVIWTGSLHTLCAGLSLPRPTLEYLGMVLYNVELRSRPSEGFQWCYFGEKSLIFNRISNNIHFSEALAPWGCCGLEVEVTCMEGEDVWVSPERYVERIVADLKRVGLLHSPREVREVHVERIAECYPIYDITYRERLRSLNKTLRSWKNLTLAGRTAQFWYNNMDHSIGRALSVSRRLLGQDDRVEGANFGREDETETL